MAFNYEEVVPWGRNFDEYCRMFDLGPHDLRKRILGCGDGPAGFNCTCNAGGGNVVSIDPLYALCKERISERIRASFDTVIEQTRNNSARFRWDRIRSVEELGEIRMAAMRAFLDSYEQGRARGHYIPGKLPDLGFRDDSFDLALSSHFLFLYSAHLSYEFHLASIREMLRVASQARIFPLVDLNTDRSAHVERLSADLPEFTVAIRRVDYEFQVGGNELMIISRT